MSNTFFKFKQFTVFQDITAMKVGVDSVLFGSYVNPQDAKNILDIGSGTGLLALMLAQKSDAFIHAVDIDIDSFLQTKINFESSKWSNRLAAEHISFQEYCMISKTSFDLIICNPPYFSNSKKSPYDKRNVARHNDSLPLNKLFEGVSKILSETGRFFIIYPFDQMDYIEKQASLNQFYPASKLIIRGNEIKKPNRIIIEFSKQEADCKSNELAVRDSKSNDYTAAYKKLTSEYYLAF